MNQDKKYHYWPRQKGGPCPVLGFLQIIVSRLTLLREIGALANGDRPDSSLCGKVIAVNRRPDNFDTLWRTFMSLVWQFHALLSHPQPPITETGPSSSTATALRRNRHLREAVQMTLNVTLSSPWRPSTPSLRPLSTSPTHLIQVVAL